MTGERRMAGAYGREASDERRVRIEAHLPVLGQMARRYASTLPQDAVSVDELLSWGAIGLCRAIDTFDPARGVPLGPYVRIQIRHAMVDGLREADRLPRRAREKERHYRAVLADLEQALGREPTEEELSAVLGGPEGLREHERAVAFSTLGSLDEPVPGPGDRDGDGMDGPTRASLLAGDRPDEDPEGQLLREERRTNLVRALVRLTERERKILMAVYDGDFTLTEVAQAMGLSVSYVARVHQHALLRVRAMMVHADHGPKVPKGRVQAGVAAGAGPSGPGARAASLGSGQGHGSGPRAGAGPPGESGSSATAAGKGGRGP